MSNITENTQMDAQQCCQQCLPPCTCSEIVSEDFQHISSPNLCEDDEMSSQNFYMGTETNSQSACTILGGEDEVHAHHLLNTATDGYKIKRQNNEIQQTKKIDEQFIKDLEEQFSCRTTHTAFTKNEETGIKTCFVSQRVTHPLFAQGTCIEITHRQIISAEDRVQGGMFALRLDGIFMYMSQLKGEQAPQFNVDDEDILDFMQFMRLAHLQDDDAQCVMQVLRRVLTVNLVKNNLPLKQNQETDELKQNFNK